MMRSTKKLVLLAAVLSGAFALTACGDANVGSPGEFKTSGGAPSQDPSGGNGATGGGSTSGGGGTSTGTSTPAANGGTFAVALQNATVASELAMSTVIPITITPAGGFTGNVTLSAAGLPAGATGTFAPTSVDITGTAPVTATYTLDVPSTVVPTTAAAAVMISGSAGASTAAAPLSLTVSRTITIEIPLNVEADSTAFGTAPIVIHAGTISAGSPITVNFINKDTSAAAGHIVHSSNTNNGFFHGDTTAPVMPNKSDAPRTVTALGDYPFYMHNENVNIGNTVSIKN
ncbi:MAG: hypothetical protein ABI183_13265 [Polyangiaceae bacterium]